MFFTSDRDDTWYTRVICGPYNEKYIIEFFIKNKEFLWYGLHSHPYSTKSIVISGRHLKVFVGPERMFNPCYYLSPEPLSKYCIPLTGNEDSDYPEDDESY
jgi:hypothetical protein